MCLISTYPPQLSEILPSSDTLELSLSLDS